MKRKSDIKAVKGVKKSRMDLIAELYPEALKMDGYDNCILGVMRRCGCPTIIVYDEGKVIKNLIRQNMSYEEAVEYYEFNQVGAWVGDNTPGFVEIL